jgi:hypothetical protein
LAIRDKMLTRFFIVPILIVGGLAACHAPDTQKSLGPKEVSACMAAEHSHDDYLLTTKCEPLASPEEFQGTWFVGYEVSVFRKGYSGVPAEIGSRLSDVDEIVVPASLSKKAHARDSAGPSAYQLVFVGRVSMLPAMPGQRLVVLDRLISIRRVPVRSSTGLR